MFERGQAQHEFEAFVNTSSLPLLRTAYLMVHDLTEAEDLVQETFLRIARHWPRVRSTEHPIAYARRTLVNLTIDGAGRRTRRKAELSLDAEVLGCAAVDQRSERAFGAVDAQTDILHALAAVSPRQRTVLVLRYWEDLSEAETARALGCSVGTVKSTASRALASLRQLMSRSNGDTADKLDEMLGEPAVAVL